MQKNKKSNFLISNESGKNNIKHNPRITALPTAELTEGPVFNINLDKGKNEIARSILIVPEGSRILEHGVKNGFELYFDFFNIKQFYDHHGVFCSPIETMLQNISIAGNNSSIKQLHGIKQKDYPQIYLSITMNNAKKVQHLMKDLPAFIDSLNLHISMPNLDEFQIYTNKDNHNHSNEPVAFDQHHELIHINARNKVKLFEYQNSQTHEFEKVTSQQLLNKSNEKENADCLSMY